MDLIYKDVFLSRVDDMVYLPVNSGVGGSGKRFREGGWGKKNPFSKTALDFLGESLTSCVGLE